VLGGAALVGVAAFAYFGLNGIADRKSLRCDTDAGCDSSSYGKVRREFVAADVGLGVAVLTAAAAAWLLFDSWHHAATAHAADAVLRF
jgi:hypothetical protein